MATKRPAHRRPTLAEQRVIGIQEPSQLAASPLDGHHEPRVERPEQPLGAEE